MYGGYGSGIGSLGGMPNFNNTMSKFKKGDRLKLRPGSEQKCGTYNGIIQSVASGNLASDPIIITMEDPDNYGMTFSQNGKYLTSCGHCWNDHDLELWKDPLKAPNDTLLKSVILDDLKKEEIMAAISQINHHEMIFTKWGFSDVFEKGTAVSLLFYGKPGTGKTLMAQAIAEYLGQELQLIQSAEVESSEPGQAERNIRAYFEGAEQNNKVLLFDECDSLIYNRDSVGAIMAAQVNVLLSSLEKYKGVVVFTTNRLGHMDPAFERRVSAKIEFPFPRQDVREKIWKRMIPKKAPLAEDVNFASLAKIPIAGGNIKNVVLNAARMAAHKKMKEINHECFIEALTKEVESMKGFSDANKRLEGRPYQYAKSDYTQSSEASKKKVGGTL